MSSNSRKAQTSKNIIIGMLFMVLLYGANFAYRYFLLQALDIEYVGAITLVTGIIAALSITELGLSGAIAYFLYKPLAESDYDKVRAIMGFFKKIYLVLAGVTLLLGLALLGFLPLFMNEPINVNPNIYIIFLFYLFSNIMNYFTGPYTTLLVADQKNYYTTIVTNSIKILAYIISATVLMITRQFLACLIIENSFVVVQFIFYRLIIRKSYPYMRDKAAKLSPGDRKEILKYAGSTFVSKLGSVVLNSTDSIIISTLIGVIVLGMYSNYFILSSGISVLVSVIVGGLTASVGNYIIASSKKDQQELFNSVSLAFSWIATFVSIGFFFASSSVISVWLGEQYLLTTDVILFMALAFYVENMARTNGLFVGVYGLVNRTVKIAILYPIVNLVSSIVFCMLFGLSGVFMGTILARLIVYPYETWIVNKYGLEQKTYKYYLRMIPFLLLTAISFGIIYLANQVRIDNIYLQLVYIVGVCTIVVNGLFLLFYFRKKEFKRLLQFIPGLGKRKNSDNVSEE